jgi:RES domain-containing protein
VYCTLTPAAALLETLVHMEIDAEDRPERFQVLRIEGPDSLSLEKVAEDVLPARWAKEISSTQTIGDRWIAEQRSLLLQVPSVLVPETWNVLVNPLHSEASSLKITMVYQHAFDDRLL